MNKILRSIKNPRLVLLYLLQFKFFRILPDKIYLQIKYYLYTAQKLDLKKPVLFTEKIQWLKLHDRREKYTHLVDKYLVRDYISAKLGSEYLIPLLGVFDNFEDIDFESIPTEKFVLKPTHTSGNVFICEDRNTLDNQLLKKEVDSWLSREYYWQHREWPYKNVKPRIICEEMLEDIDGKPPMDYKIFCFHGVPKLIQVDIDRFGEHKQNFYDPDWNFKDIEIWCENDSTIKVPKPKNLNKMLEISRKLSESIPHIRVDLYNVNGQIFFGELTFYHLSGFKKIKTKGLDEALGNLLELSLV